MNSHSATLVVENLNISLRQPAKLIPLVSQLDLELRPGTITGLAGESGCGKSLTALALMGLLDPAGIQVTADRWLLNGTDLTHANEGTWQQQRGRQIAMVFQDPATALDPVLRIGQQMKRVLARLNDRAGVESSVLGALEAIGFADAPRIARSYPHELSGGMRQLVVIAMAHAVKPAVLLADEPTTALDAGTQQIVLQQLGRLSAAGTAVLLITHELQLLARDVARVLVMYHGKIIESLPGNDFLALARHPYSAGLIAATPQICRSRNLPPFEPIPGQVPAPGQAGIGCAFAPRCPHADTHCERESPELRASGQSRLACHHPLGATS